MIHKCHWPSCAKPVPPKMWACREHWFKLPKLIRDAIWDAYVPGQEVTKTPSSAYLRAAEEARIFAVTHDGEEATKKKAAAVRKAIDGAPENPGQTVGQVEFSDRYSAIGKKPPSPDTVCLGHCEGMGFYPTKNKAEWPENPDVDDMGYVFVKCKDCSGTGLRVGGG